MGHASLTSVSPSLSVRMARATPTLPHSKKIVRHIKPGPPPPKPSRAALESTRLHPIIERVSSVWLTGGVVCSRLRKVRVLASMSRCPQIVQYYWCWLEPQAEPARAPSAPRGEAASPQAAPPPADRVPLGRTASAPLPSATPLLEVRAQYARTAIALRMEQCSEPQPVP